MLFFFLIKGQGGGLNRAQDTNYMYREKKREKFVFISHLPLKMQRNLRMKKELQMFVQSPPHGVSCWTNDEDNMTQLTARKDVAIS